MAVTTALAFLCIITRALGQQATSDGCYREYTNSKVNCMTSYMSQNVASQQECTALCSQNSPKCKAVQLTTDTKSCQLFDTALKVYRTTNRRRRLAGCYGYGPSVITAPGSSYYLPTGYGTGCSGYGGGLTSASTLATQTDPPTVPTEAPTTTTTPTTTTASTTAVQTESSTTAAATTTTTQPTVSSTVSDPQLPPEATCPSGKVVRYTVVEGYQLSGTPDFTFQAANEQACLTACTNNKLPDGRQAPCRSADFNAKTQQCSISLQVTPPEGTTAAAENADSKHFEKVCVNDTIGQNCPGSYFRSPQHILIGFAQAVATASSTVECLELCASAQSRFGFVCSSGMFYFAETSNNCILNSDTRATHPELFVPENNDGVEYFEPGCTTSARVVRQVTGPKKRNRNILELNSEKFGAWSMCDTVQRSHMRFRLCATLNPNRCDIDLNGCDPAKESDYDRDGNATAPIGRLILSKKGSSLRRGSFPTPKAGTTPKPTTPKMITTPTPPAKTTSPKPSDCIPLVKTNGRSDCDNGIRKLPNGKSQSCRPSKKECEQEETKRGKQKGRNGPH